MSGQLQFDAAAARELQSFYLSPMAIERRKLVRRLLDLHAGDSVLDLGVGPGFLSREMAEEVGSAGTVTSVDGSPDMLELARRRCSDRAEVRFVQADVSAIPLASGVFDAACVVQVYEYVRDMPAALGELRRVLRRGGRAVIMDTDWSSLVWEAQDRQRAEKIFDAWDEHLADSHLPRRLAPLLRDAGFELTSVQPYTAISLDSAASIAGLARLIADFVPGRRGVTAEDAAAWLADLEESSARGRYFFSLTAYAFLATASGP